MSACITTRWHNGLFRNKQPLKEKLDPRSAKDARVLLFIMTGGAALAGAARGGAPMAATTGGGGCFSQLHSWDERALGRWERKGHPRSAYRQARPTGPCTYLGMWSWTFLPPAVSANFVSPQAPRVSCRPPTFAIVLEQENGYRICTTIRYSGIRNWLDPSRKVVISYSGAGLCRKR